MRIALQTLDIGRRGRRRRSAFLRAGIAARRLGVREPRPERLLDEIVHHRLGRVIDAVALALRQLCDRLAAFKLAFAIFQFGNGLLEDVAEDVEAEAFLHVAARSVVVSGAEVDERVRIALQRRFVRTLSGFGENMVRNAQAVDQRVRREQPAVDFRQREAIERAAAVHQAKQALEEIPKLRPVLVVERLDAAASQKILEHLRRKQHPFAHVFAEEGEDEAVEKFLSEPQQFAGAARKVRIVQSEDVIEALAHLLVAIIELTFELAPACPLPLHETEEQRPSRFRQQHVAGEQLGEKITVEPRIFRIRLGGRTRPTEGLRAE